LQRALARGERRERVGADADTGSALELPAVRALLEVTAGSEKVQVVVLEFL
jgi:hypothetical protein